VVRLSYRGVALLVTALVALLSACSIAVNAWDVVQVNSRTDAMYAEAGTR
jgi:hypothetical protein